MASSVIEVCNRALDSIGADPIVSLDDPNKRAGLCARYYPQLRDELLRSHPWNCATARATLPALAAAPEWQFSRAFQLPTDCLRVLALDGPDAFDAPWKVEGTTIVTDRPAPLRILYIRSLDTPGAMDPMLVSALVARLAMELAVPIAQDKALRQIMEREFLARLRAARSADGQEGTPQRIAADDLIRARFG